jgi:hypothetical protein
MSELSETKNALDLFEPEEIDGSFASFVVESDDANRARAVPVLEGDDDESV